MESSSILRNKADKILHKYSLLESEELGKQLANSEEQFDLESLFQQGRGDIVQHSELNYVKKTKGILSEMEPCIEDLQHLKKEVTEVFCGFVVGPEIHFLGRKHFRRLHYTCEYVCREREK